jgi:hypothetical protein
VTPTNSFLTGTTTPTVSSSGIFFINTSTQTLTISFLQSTPSIATNSYWYNPSNGSLNRYVLVGGFNEWVTPSGTLLTGTTTPTVSDTGIFFVNTSLQTLSISVIVSTPTIATNSYWYNPNNGNLNRYVLVGGFNEWVTPSGTLLTGTTTPSISSTGVFFVNTSLATLSISVITSTPTIATNSYWFNPNNGSLNRYVLVGGFNEWVTPSNILLTGTTTPTISSTNVLFVNTSLETLSISVIVSTPTITTNSYWFNSSNGSINQYVLVGGFNEWVTPSNILLTGTTTPFIDETGVLFVNTTAQTLSISVVVSTPSIPTNSLWYNPSNGTLNQYLLIGGFNEWNSVSVIFYVATVEPRPTLAGQYWVNPSNQILSVSQIVPPSNPVLVSNDFNQVIITRTGNNLYLTLIPDINYPNSKNQLLIKNVGIYAFDTNTNTAKFLFAINDYVEGSNSGSNTRSNINLYINNWKI